MKRLLHNVYFYILLGFLLFSTSIFIGIKLQYKVEEPPITYTGVILKIYPVKYGYHALLKNKNQIIETCISTSEAITLKEGDTYSFYEQDNNNFFLYWIFFLILSALLFILPISVYYNKIVHDYGELKH